MKHAGLVFLLLSVVLVSVILLPAGCATKNNSLNDAHRIAQPYTFPFLKWECNALFKLGMQAVSDRDHSNSESDLSKKIEFVLQEQGISVFPPVLISLESPPHLLVISPRDTIAYTDRLLLQQTMRIDEMESLEAQIDELGFSSLVVTLGGFAGTFPPIVSSDSTMKYIVNAGVEEWLHQYLAFKPLGFRYVLDSLGIRRDVDIVTMNETLAGIISEDIGKDVYNKYYSNSSKADDRQQSNVFDFDAVMRETRKQTDAYLSQGNIERAETYMEEQRKLFVQNGYHIRKLNQAYFAFHGIYGQDPGAVSPVARDIEQLKAISRSTKDFLDTAAAMTGYEDLKRKLNK